MTASVYVTGTHVASLDRDPVREGGNLNQAANLAHAVSKPVVDGLASSVCGVLVTATADMQWRDVWRVPRCEECQRIAG
jgi:hypothetical protein